FGNALIAMPLLTPLIGIGAAAPLFALVSLTNESITLYRYRQHLNFRAVWRLILASVIAIPIGVTVASSLNQTWVLFLLGIIITAYGSYSLLKPSLPQIHNSNWSFGFGFIAGLLSGAYNTGGPPVVIYGNLSRWAPTEFKSNLQSAFVFNSLFVVTIHTLN